MYTMGLDIGSTTSKGIILEDGIHILATSLIRVGIGSNGGLRCVNQLLELSKTQLTDMAYIMATGYGRKNFSLAEGEMSELSCHAKGVHFLCPKARTIIDIGGQDAKVLCLSAHGNLENFVMNDKCAAGTGRFLDVMSTILQIPIEQLEDYARASKSPAMISSTCTVFAESEVISQLSNGCIVEDVIAGICNSVASRVASLVKRIGIKETVFMSGGVANNGGVRDALEKELKTSIMYSQESQLMGAVGAALYAYEKCQKR